GRIEGSLVAESENDVLTISETGSIKGKVKAANMIINGTIEGDITATGKIEVAAHARINGSIYYVNIEMETGSQVNGQLIYQGTETTPITKLKDKEKINDKK
ncbi:MAG: polymer-forming cytoskeletal protein, partial [Proteobacteria bacterium]|nr:polymer-forming cytoskeletal protein [Pseudomonadota bacterium]